MKIIELHEDASTYENTARILLEECAPFLQQTSYNVANYPLLRGDRRSPQQFGELAKRQVRLEDRRPANTNIYMHNAMNRFFQKQFGAPFRSALFASGSATTAQTYGDAMICSVFPIGQFKFVWSPKVRDAFTIQTGFRRYVEPTLVKKYPDMPQQQLDDIRELVYNMTVKYGYKPNVEEITQLNRVVFDVLEALKFQDTDMVSAIDSKHEIAIRCPEVYIVLFDNSFPEEPYKGVHTEAEKLQQAINIVRTQS